MAEPPLGVPDWWPLAASSRAVDAAGLRWHVQQLGATDPQAPVALLLHGTGASAHSWRHLAPLLARDFHVIAPDLPGHAFTQTPAAQALSLPAVAAAVDAMLQRLGRRPTLLVGHSAGAAVALRMVLDGRVAPALTVSINGALLPLQGPLGRLFMPMARLLAANPFVPPAFAAWAALPTMTRRLLDSTGSRIEALGERCYAHLVATPAHAAGALRLMSAWDLTPLASELPHLDLPLLLLAAGRDRTLPPEHAQRVLRLLPKAGHALLPGFGHLVHEEDAPAVLAAIRGAWPGVRAAAPARLVA